jgi:hypothetical protein
LPCLDSFKGDYVIHVGELSISGTILGVPTAPFGRTSSADFQVTLAETFHPLLIAELVDRFPYSRDCISVWKRTEFIKGRDDSLSKRDKEIECSVDEKDNSVDSVEFASICS